MYRLRLLALPVCFAAFALLMVGCQKEGAAMREADEGVVSFESPSLRLGTGLTVSLRTDSRPATDEGKTRALDVSQWTEAQSCEMLPVVEPGVFRVELRGKDWGIDNSYKSMLYGVTFLRYTATVELPSAAKAVTFETEGRVGFSAMTRAMEGFFIKNEKKGDRQHVSFSTYAMRVSMGYDGLPRRVVIPETMRAKPKETNSCLPSLKATVYYQ